jgi:RHS repeat-associated protein
MSATTPSQTLYSIGYDFHVGNGNNGNVFGITNYKDTTHGRDQTFSYDALNRVISAQNAGTNCAATTVNGKTEYWGNNYGYDPWGNLLNKSVTKCSAENFSVAALANNRLSGYGYDAAGNMTTDPTDNVTLNYDQENRITGSAGYTYTYDSDGNRVRKSNGNLAANGTLYWYMTPGVVAETDLAGTTKSEYIFFDGERVARRDGATGTGGVFYYFSDHLKTASVITDSAGVIKSESDYYPWGGELQLVNNDTNDYKFTVKKRATETGLDYFGARYYSNGMGRFVTPDWSAGPNQKNPTTQWEAEYLAFVNDNVLYHSLFGFARLLGQGWTDALRKCHPEGPLWTFWDYKFERWPADKGMRLDHFLLSTEMSERLVSAGVDRWVRGEINASDHAPVWINLDV